MIPDNISGEHIQKALSEIVVNEIPASRKEVHYQFIDNERILPPKYIISVANKYANGTELESSEFNAVEAKNYLQKKGFKVVDKRESNNESEQRFWIEKTLVNGRPDRIDGERALGRALWSPQKDKRGADIYKNMRAVSEGDIILHLINNSVFSGISIVQKSAVEANGISGTEWDGPAYLIKLKNYTELTPKISRNDLLNTQNRDILNYISNDSEVFYNKNLELRQGAYLTPCPYKLVSLLNNIYQQKAHTDLPHVNLPKSLRMNQKPSEAFKKDLFFESLSHGGLIYSQQLSQRFIASLLTKPFVILTGLSGSGKTKLAQAFTQWICQDESQYCMVPVGADWTNREPLLGYPNALKPNEYVKPDNGVLDLIFQANRKPELPHFLILDEMNLSHVERYFADFLSAMESGEAIPLLAEDTGIKDVPSQLELPCNLFIIGTVNIDETTNMFSPKVLDRANTIEFRITKNEISSFLDNTRHLDMSALSKKGAPMAKNFLELAENREFESQDSDEINKTLVNFFDQLKKAGAEFGYRSAAEILRLMNQLSVLDSNLTINKKLDIAIMQKLLPKLHGSRRKLCPVLEKLGGFCVNDQISNVEKEVFSVEDFDFDNTEAVKFPLSLEKIARMYQGAVSNGFASFAEA